MLFRSALLAIFVPIYGMTGFLVTYLISQLFITGLDVLVVCKNVSFPLDPVNSLVKPGVTVFILGSFLYKLYEFIVASTTIKPIFVLFLLAFVMVFLTLVILVSLKAIKKGEWHI